MNEIVMLEPKPNVFELPAGAEGPAPREADADRLGLGYWFATALFVLGLVVAYC